MCLKLKSRCVKKTDLMYVVEFVIVVYFTNILISDSLQVIYSSKSVDFLALVTNTGQQKG